MGQLLVPVADLYLSCTLHCQYAIVRAVLCCFPNLMDCWVCNACLLWRQTRGLLPCAPAAFSHFPWDAALPQSTLFLCYGHGCSFPAFLWDVVVRFMGRCGPRAAHWLHQYQIQSAALPLLCVLQRHHHKAELGAPWWAHTRCLGLVNYRQDPGSCPFTSHLA